MSAAQRVLADPVSVLLLIAATVLMALSVASCTPPGKRVPFWVDAQKDECDAQPKLQWCRR